jgi:hypothetical protein
MGHISYSINAKSGLSSGREIRNVALISFDNQLQISTDQVDPLDPTKGIDPNKQARITIDAGLPASSVVALPVSTTVSTFSISWSGIDDVGGSGISGYDIYVSRNSGVYTRFLTSTTLTSTNFIAEFGNTYRFYSVAIDNTGQRQPIPTTAQAQTFVADPRTVNISVASSKPNGLVYGESVTISATFVPQLPSGPTPTGNAQFTVDGIPFGSPVDIINGSAAIPMPRLIAGARSIAVQYLNSGGVYDNKISSPFTQNVAKALLTIVANDKQKFAGDPIPSLDYSVIGFLAGDTVGNSTSGSPVLSAPPQSVATAGIHSITVASGSLTSTNYRFAFINGILTVNTKIAGRNIFYQGTNFDTTTNSQGAVDPTKRVLLPGEVATFANYTNYVGGIRSFILDLVGLGSNPLSSTNFVFATWNALSAEGFVPFTAVPTIAILSNEGMSGSTRIKVQFDENMAPKNTWLRINVLANTNTWLASPDVFYIGNAIGDLDVANTSTEVRVNAIDTGLVRSNQSPNPNSVGIDNKFDLNKDGRVNSIDTGIVRANQAIPTIGLLNAPSSSSSFRSSSLSVVMPLEKTKSIGIGVDSSKEFKSKRSQQIASHQSVEARVSAVDELHWSMVDRVYALQCEPKPGVRVEKRKQFDRVFEEFGIELQENMFTETKKSRTAVKYNDAETT